MTWFLYCMAKHSEHQIRNFILLLRHLLIVQFINFLNSSLWLKSGTRSSAILTVHVPLKMVLSWNILNAASKRLSDCIQTCRLACATSQKTFLSVIKLSHIQVCHFTMQIRGLSGNYKIPAGVSVALMIYSMHQNPKFRSVSSLKMLSIDNGLVKKHKVTALKL